MTSSAAPQAPDPETGHALRGPDEMTRALAAHHAAAWAWARNCCRSDPQDAQEILQLSYLKVLDGRARFDGQSAFKTWLFGVIRLTAAHERRQRFLHDVLALRWGAEPLTQDAAPGADAAVERRQSRSELEAGLARLPRRQREVLLLVFYHELSVEEAAAVMAIGVGSARQHYARGKQRLRQWLAPEEASR